jgi:hypothetical protein
MGEGKLSSTPEEEGSNVRRDVDLAPKAAASAAAEEEKEASDAEDDFFEG